MSRLHWGSLIIGALLLWLVQRFVLRNRANA